MSQFGSPPRFPITIALFVKAKTVTLVEGSSHPGDVRRCSCSDAHLSVSGLAIHDHTSSTSVTRPLSLSAMDHPCVVERHHNQGGFEHIGLCRDSSHRVEHQRRDLAHLPSPRQPRMRSRQRLWLVRRTHLYTVSRRSAGSGCLLRAFAVARPPPDTHHRGRFPVVR
jgi:hypothetical protein